MTDSAEIPDEQRYSLHLYVAGSTARSMQAIKNIRRMCERYLAGNYDLEVIDIYLHPEMAADAQIIAAPTLVKLNPSPTRRAIGDLSNEVKLLAAMNIAEDGDPSS
jgi:circadian clock protein KaiB